MTIKQSNETPVIWYVLNKDKKIIQIFYEERKAKRYMVKQQKIENSFKREK